MTLRLGDSDVLIGYLNEADPGRAAVRVLLQTGELVCSAVSRYEVWIGLRTPAQGLSGRALFAQIPVLPLTDEAAFRASGVAQRLEAIGMKLPALDLLIAGTALVRNIPLLTRNVRHFARIPGLTVLSP